MLQGPKDPVLPTLTYMFYRCTFRRIQMWLFKVAFDPIVQILLTFKSDKDIIWCLSSICWTIKSNDLFDWNQGWTVVSLMFRWEQLLLLTVFFSEVSETLKERKYNLLIFFRQKVVAFSKGPFNNYVDKMRGEGVKNVCFCPTSGYKNCPRSCWMRPKGLLENFK